MSLSRILANIGTALDSATTGDFLSKVDSDGVFGGVAYSSVTGTPTVLDSANVTNLIDSAYVQLRQSAVSGGGLDSATTIILIDSDYITSRATASGFQMFEYDATAGQTVFTGSDVNGNTLAYSEYGLLVHYNGILLSGATDYTATDGTTVVLTDSADADARITIAKWSLASAGGGAGGASFTWGGDRAIVAGGYTGAATASIYYFNIATTGSAVSSFGSLTSAKTFLSGGCSNTTYGVIAGGYTGSRVDDMDYITIATPSNASDFGNLTSGRDEAAAGSNGIYGLMAGGNPGGYTNIIDYITIATPSNATDFGDLNAGLEGVTTTGDATYLLFAGGHGPINDIQYVTADTPSNTTDFGDLTVATDAAGSLSDETRSVFAGGLGYLNTIGYVTTSTPSNATDFGDLTVARRNPAAASNGTVGTFAGGNNGTNQIGIDYITIQTASNATDWGDDLLIGTGYAAGLAGNAA